MHKLKLGVKILGQISYSPATANIWSPLENNLLAIMIK